MSRGETGPGGAGRGHWRPVTPVSAMVVGRLVLGVPGAIGLTAIVCAWSIPTGAGLGLGRVALFSLTAVSIREAIDASAHRIIMRARRSRDAHGLLLTLVAVLCPAVAGFLAARLLAPASTTTLTVLTWLLFMAFVALVERPWDTSLGYGRHPGAHPPAPADPTGVRHRRLPRRPPLRARAQPGRTGRHRLALHVLKHRHRPGQHSADRCRTESAMPLILRPISGSILLPRSCTRLILLSTPEMLFPADRPDPHMTGERALSWCASSGLHLAVV